MSLGGGHASATREGYFPPAGTSTWVLRADEATLSVVAHGLLRSVTVVQGGVETLRLRWDVLDDEAREEIMQAVMDHAVLIGASLQDLVRGMGCGEIPSTDDMVLWDRPKPTVDLTSERAPDANGHDGRARRSRPQWVPTYAHCPRCRYRGVYVVSGRSLIRCRYCRAIGDLTEDECAVAAEHPEQFLTRLAPPTAVGTRARC
jgi:hypothetical protein